MLTVTKTSAARAVSYYTDESLGESLDTSSWFGVGAGELAMEGTVSPDDFGKLLAGEGPNGEALLQIRQPSRAEGYDLTMSAPKSVSVAALVYENSDIEKAHHDAVNATLREVEGFVQTRQMLSGKRRYPETNNTIFANFPHRTNRNSDPQLHTHSILMNATLWQGKWRSIHARRLFERVKEVGKNYRDRLADNVRSLGHSIRQVGEFWELKSISQKVVEHFSSRRRQIVALVGSQATRAAKQFATFVTRNKKSQVPLEYLRHCWKESLNDENLNNFNLDRQQSIASESRER